MARPAFDLDQPEALFGQDEQIDFIDCSIRRLELKIGPRPVRVMIGQTRPDEVQTTPFPFILRWRDAGVFR